jgi:predicted outer membrane repeat protein
MNHRNQPRFISMQLGLLSFLGCLALVGSGLARANTLEVDSPTEFSVQGCSLRQAIANHNAKGSVGFNSCLFGSENDKIDITNNITDVFLNSPLPAISGTLRIVSDLPVSMHGAYFTVNQGAKLGLYSMSDVVAGVADFRTNQSMFVNNGGNLIISGGTFSNNGAAGGIPDSGGVIFNRAGMVDVDGAVFKNNACIQRGCAIYNNAALTIEGAMFLENSGLPDGIGGAIYNDRLGSIRVSDGGAKNLIAQNSASYGGAIYNNHGAIRIASSNFSISDNSAGFNGGAIYTSGGGITISRGSGSVVTDIAIASNVAGDTGGGIYDHHGHLSISGIEIKGNTADHGGATAVTGNGGGLVVDNDSANITQTYFHDNVATSNGGAIYNTNGSSLSITASTFAHDLVTGADNQFGGAAAILNDGASEVAITNSTVVGELPDQDPEGIQVPSGTGEIVNVTLNEAVLSALGGDLSIRNSILAGVHCFFSASDAGNNLQFGDVLQCPGASADPALDPNGLQFNGGPTPTIAILKNSAAINAIPRKQCTGPRGNRLKTDQRGFTRPAPNQKGCDIGAFEFGAQPSTKEFVGEF